MGYTYRKSRAILDHAGRMYALLEEMTYRCTDPVFKSASRRMVREIRYEAGESEE